ncbi:MAG: hypothetical protein ACXVWF_10095 [Actinomycetota bacterium]
MSIANRLKTNPGVWALVLGGLVAFLGSLARLITIHGPKGDSSIWSLKTTTGTSLLFVALLVILCGAGVAVAAGGGRIWWALLGGLLALVTLLFGLLCVVNPQEAAIRMAYTEAYSTAVGGVVPPGGIADAYRSAFDAGTLTATANFGAWLAAIGGAVALVGAAISLVRPHRKVVPEL